MKSKRPLRKDRVEIYLKAHVEPSLTRHKYVNTRLTTLGNEYTVFEWRFPDTKPVIIGEGDKVYGKILSTDNYHVHRLCGGHYKGKQVTAATQIRNGDIFRCCLINDSGWKIIRMRAYKPDNIDDMIECTMQELGIKQVMPLPDDSHIAKSVWKWSEKYSFSEVWSNTRLEKRIYQNGTETDMFPSNLVTWDFHPTENTWILHLENDGYTLLVGEKYYDKMELLMLLNATLMCRKEKEEVGLYRMADKTSYRIDVFPPISPLCFYTNDSNLKIHPVEEWDGDWDPMGIME